MCIRDETSARALPSMASSSLPKSRASSSSVSRSASPSSSWTLPLRTAAVAAAVAACVRSTADPQALNARP